MIRLKLKSVFALVLSVMMISLSVPVEAQTAKTSVKSSTQAVGKVKETESNDNSFAEGEAIILYNSSSLKTKSFSSEGGLGTTIEIEETYDFSNGNKAVGAKSTDTSNNGFLVSLVKSDKYTTEELVKVLKKRTDIKYAEPNYRIKVMDTNDAYTQHQWALDNVGQNGGTEGLDINADAETMRTIVDDKEKVIALFRYYGSHI